MKVALMRKLNFAGPTQYVCGGLQPALVAARHAPSGRGAHIFYPRGAAAARHCHAHVSTGLLEPSAKALIPFVDIQAFRRLAAHT
jgi:hypothetical protein